MCHTEKGAIVYTGVCACVSAVIGWYGKHSRTEGRWQKERMYNNGTPNVASPLPQNQHRAAARPHPGCCAAGLSG